MHYDVKPDYDIKPDYDAPEYKRSRYAYIAEGTIQYFIRLLAADAFLAKLLLYVGVSDGLIGIISSFISLAFVIQLMTVFIVKMKMGTKKQVILFDTISVFFFMLLYLIPFFPVTQQQKTVLVVVSIIVAYGANYLISSVCFRWTSSYVDPTKRARFSATMEIISLISGILFTAAAGYVIDRYEGMGELERGFLFIAVAIFILNLMNFISYLLIAPEKKEKKQADAQSLMVVMRSLFGKKEYVNVLILTTLWQMAIYFTIGFMGTYKTKELGISLFVVQLINMAGSFGRMVLSRPFGNYSDKYSFAKGFRMALYLMALAFFVNMFTMDNTWFLVIVFTVLYNCSLAGTNQNSSNILFSYVDSTYIAQAQAIKCCISGICGFGSSILASVILEAIQENGNQLFGMRIYGQQVLSLISLVLTVAAIVFSIRVVEKQKVYKR